MNAQLMNGIVVELIADRNINDIIVYNLQGIVSSSCIEEINIKSKARARELTVIERLEHTDISLDEVESMRTITKAPKCKHNIGDRVAIFIEDYGVKTMIISKDCYDPMVFDHVKYVCKVRANVNSLNEAYVNEII